MLYTHDPVGNRLSLTQGTTTSSTYDKADQILTVGGQSYTVDANGNLTSFPSNSLSYDQANRLKSATISGTTTTYAYDGDGTRASKTVGSTTTSYVYDANNSLPSVLTDGSRKYVYGLGLAYATDMSGNVQAVYHSDGLSSVRALTNANGSLIQTYQTDPFGVPTQTQGTSGQPFGYTGQQQDAESSFVFLRTRYYDPALGRFLTHDTFFGFAVDPSSLNRFSYVTNNPATFSDRQGKYGGGDCQVLGQEYLDQNSCSGGGGEGGLGAGAAGDVGSTNALADPNAEPGPSTASQATAQSYNAGSTPANQVGNTVHYDQQNGGTGFHLPSQLQDTYPETKFNFAQRFESGPDVEVVDGRHPSSYPNSTWPSGSDYGDFKPDTASGRATLRSDIASGKLPQGTVGLPYNPDTQDLSSYVYAPGT